MSIRLTGKEAAASILERTKEQADRMTASGHAPKIAIVRVGEKKSDLAYEAGIKRNADKAGVQAQSVPLPPDITEEELIAKIHALNDDASVSGILLFLPLPKGLNEAAVVNAIAPEKDLDGATDASKLGVYTGSGIGYPPCTAQAVMEILHYYNIPIGGKRAVVVGRSLVVGKPLSQMLLKENATVTICHSKTEDMPSVTKEADILISATGHIGTLTKEHVAAGQCVIDVGINFNSDGKMTGDVLYDEVSEIVDAITPVPGGVGAVTTAVLLSHAVHHKTEAAPCR